MLMSERGIKVKGIFIDGDFPVKESQCRYYCQPSCHPLNVGPGPMYGCLNPLWPTNQCGDFCPPVECGGLFNNCDVPDRFIENEELFWDRPGRREYAERLLNFNEWKKQMKESGNKYGRQ
jgi:hypothetical protein